LAGIYLHALVRALMQQEQHAQLKRTPLYRLQTTLNARFMPFAGYDLPSQFSAGILKEHLHTRSAAGLFDVSHMGQFVLRPRNGDLKTAAQALERLMPQDLMNLAPGRQRYGLFTNDAGGILDDLMISNGDDHFLLIVNAACKDEDEAYLRAALDGICIVETRNDLALLALQGPNAQGVLEVLCPESASMRFMDVRELKIAGVPCVVSRSGYTGEDGFEISVPSSRAEFLGRQILDIDGVLPIGLGARDSLRLEAGLCLYGSDLDPATTPVEAALEWAIQKSRRTGGSRQGGFPGSAIILRQIEAGAPRYRVGLLGQERTPARAGCSIFLDETAAVPIGQLTSGGFSPSLQMPIAMGMVPASESTIGKILFVEVRNRRVPMIVSKLPFVPTRYRRDP
jgi:aminomethyltransferase